MNDLKLEDQWGPRKYITNNGTLIGEYMQRTADGEWKFYHELPWPRTAPDSAIQAFIEHHLAILNLTTRLTK